MHGNPPIGKPQATATERMTNRLFPACQALFMSAAVTLVAVIVSGPPGTPILAAYGDAWALTLPVAIVAAYIARPISSRLAGWLARRVVDS